MRDLFEMCGIGLLFTAMAAFLMASLYVVAVIMSYLIDPHICAATASQMRVEHTWTLFGGCVVEYRGEWVPLDKLQINGVDVKGRKHD